MTSSDFLKKWKIVEAGTSSKGSAQTKNRFPPAKNAIFEKIIFDCDVIVNSSTSYDTHPWAVVISRTKFHVCTFSSYGGDNT